MRNTKKDSKGLNFQKFKTFEIPISKQNQIKGGGGIINDDLDVLIVVDDIDQV